MAVEKSKLEEDASFHRFYKIVLGWDYVRLLKESIGKEKNKKGKDGNALCLKKVKDTYKDVNEYLETFEPLLFEEVKANILQDNDDESAKWKEVLLTECNESGGFHLPVVKVVDDEDFVSNSDLLLLSKKQFGVDTEIHSTYAFALLEQRQGEVLRLRMYLNGEIKALETELFEPSVRLLKMRSMVAEINKPWFVLKVCNMSTIVREYVALRSISTLSFKDLILSAADGNNDPEDKAWEISSALWDFIKSNHNESQLDAIRVGLSRKGFLLIQGPPGTGKTQTILGILSVILHATPMRIHAKGQIHEMKARPEMSLAEKYKHWEKASPWLHGINPRDLIKPKGGDDGFFPESGNEMKPEVVNSNRKYRVRVLVCAPSNSALDEIVLRLLNTGIRNEDGRSYNPKIVRIGSKAHHSIQSVSMNYLVDQRLAGMAGDEKNGNAGRKRDSIRDSILDEAAIVFSTLSTSGSLLKRCFDVVIIDEAAQAVEPATLIPLATGCKQVFLVGDPVQLPATVLSSVAQNFGYGMSLFKRFQQAGFPVTMLKTQYRMHPEIRSFPSKEFYQGELEDGPDLQLQTGRSWHEYKCFGPFCFFDIHEGRESQPSGHGGSSVNEDEVEFVLNMYGDMLRKYPELKRSSRVGIISPYGLQVKLFNNRFREMFGVSSENVDIKTVDGFQGREKDVIFFSCVRASGETGSIGFLKDFRRMNVGITRARASVLVVGSATTLKRDPHWKRLVENADQRNCLFKVSKPYNTFFSEENMNTMKVASQPIEEEAPTDEIEIDVPFQTTVSSANLEPVDDDQGYRDGGGDGDADADGGYEGDD